MSDEHILVGRAGDVVTITLNRPARRNALSLALLRRLRDALREVGDSDALAVVLAGAGPVFSAGHDFAEMAGADLEAMRTLLWTCTEVMETVQSIPQVVCARVHGLATAAGCQLVASCDLAVAASSATFAVPGGQGGWFCTTPLVALARAVPPRRALEMGLTGDRIDARTAEAWGLVNRVVDDDELDAGVAELVARATRGSRASRAIGKRAFYTQVGLDQRQAYAYAVEVMAAASQLRDAREGMVAFVEKRPPIWEHR